MVVNKAVTISGAGGAENTILAGAFPASTNRILSITTNAVVDGFTISNGYLQASFRGAGVSLSAGLLRNCRIVNNRINWLVANAPQQGSGGGIELTGGIVSNCVIEGNITSNCAGGVYIGGPGTLMDCWILNNSVSYPRAGSGRGGGIYFDSTLGRVERCVIAGNQAPYSGGGLYMANGTVVASLIVSNTLAAFGGGAHVAGGRLLAATVADNVATNNGGGVVLDAGAVTNGIIWGNSALRTGGTNDLAYKSGTVVYTCSSNTVTGTGNITNNPLFAGAGNYRLAFGSPCIDSGIADGVARDLDGYPRPRPGYAIPTTAYYDRGAFEAYHIDGGPLRCDFSAEALRVVEGRPISFVSLIAGGDTNDLYFTWSFGTNLVEGFALDVISNAFNLPPGSNRMFVTIGLTISNLSGSASAVKTNLIEVGRAVHYVSPSGGHLFPFLSWADAATNLQDAIDAALDTGDVNGPLIRVANGVYPIRRELVITNSAQIRSENGAAATTIYRPTTSTNRLVVLSNQYAVVDGFTLTNGFLNVGSAQGGAVRLFAGSLLNCLIQSNRVYTSSSGNPVFGGGIYMSGGLVSNCVIRLNAANPLQAYAGRPDGGGVYMTAGRIMNSFITDNFADGGITHPYGGTGDGLGGGLYMTGGELINTVVARNWTHAEGGGVYMTGGRILHATIAYNSTRLTNSAGLFLGGGVVSNSIIYRNRRYCDDVHVNIRQTGGSIAYSCTYPLWPGEGNIAAEPDWTAPTNNDFTLLPGSPCLDGAAWLADVPADGTSQPRSQDGDGDGIALPDIGAFEAVPPTSGPLRCNFKAVTNEAVDSLAVDLVPIVAGANTNIALLRWDWNGDGTIDAEDFALSPYAASYEAGHYSPSLFVSNTVGEVVTLKKPDYIRVFPSAVFVATNGASIFPFNSWSKATRNLQEAVVAVADGGMVTLSNGTFVISNTPPVVLAKGIEVRSLNGPRATILRGGRRIELVNPNAALRGVTITASRGIQMSAGVVADCIITNCASHLNISVAPTIGNYRVPGGGGGLISGGLIERCIIASNTTYNTANGDAHGGGLYMTGGTASNCLILANLAYTAAGYSGKSQGGGVCLAGPGRLVNCTIARNEVKASNALGSYGGGVYRSNAQSLLQNTIVWFNRGTNTIEDIYTTVSETNMTYSCSPSLTHNPAGTGNITNNPLFVVIGEGFGLTNRYTDGHLSAESPCRNAGSPDPELAATLDLDGRPRVSGGRVDMGCYEIPPQKGTFILIR